MKEEGTVTAEAEPFKQCVVIDVLVGKRSFSLYLRVRLQSLEF